MKKENILFGIVGLLAGLIIGFMFANSVNNAALKVPGQPPAANTPAASAGGNPALPPDHPPLGTTSGAAPNAGAPNAGAMDPKVSSAIEKARSEPQNFEAQMTAADLYYQIERYDEAVKFYEAASALRPADTEPMIKAGNAYFDSNKFEDAEKWYLRALDKDPKNLNVRTDLGLTFYLRSPRDIDRAIKEYKASLAINPDHEVTLQNLALAYREKGDTENNRATMEKLKKINPNNELVTNPDGK